MTSMLERVARAMFNASGEEYGMKWAMNPDNRARWKMLARTAIEAMREPTEAMVEAASATGEYGGISDHGAPEPNDFDPEDVWDAMITAALADA